MVRRRRARLALWSSPARFGGVNLAAPPVEAIRAGAFVGDLVEHGEVTARSRFVRQPDARRRHEKRTAAFHHIYLLRRQRDFDTHRRWIMRPVCDGIGIACTLRHYATTQERQRNRAGAKRQNTGDIHPLA